MDEEDFDKSFNVSPPLGTLPYMAPEAIKGKTSWKVDVYAFGVVKSSFA